MRFLVFKNRHSPSPLPTKRWGHYSIKHYGARIDSYFVGPLCILKFNSTAWANRKQSRRITTQA